MENKFTPIKIIFIKEEAKEKNKKGIFEVSKNPQGEINYMRNDLIGLMALLRRFDTRIHPPKDWKMSIKIKDKLTEAYVNELESIDLNLDQASFLKLYLKEMSDKEGQKDPLPEHELRTLFGVLEQFESGEEK